MDKHPLKIVQRIKVLSLAFLLPLVSQWALSADAADKFTVLHLQSLPEDKFQPIVTTLNRSGQAYTVLQEQDAASFPAGTLLLPLANQLSEKTLARVEDFIAHGGKVILIPPTDAPDMNTFKLFKELQIYLSGSTFASQTLELKWSKEQLPDKDFLPVSSRVLMIQATGEAQVEATWDTAFPAVVMTPKGAFLNWSWGKELSANTNIDILHHVLGRLDTSASTTATAPATNEGGTGVAAVPAEPEKPEIDYGTYSKKMRDLDDYKQRVSDAIESGLQLSLPMPIKKAEQLLLESDVHKAKYESLYLGGDPLNGNMEYDQAKRLILEALTMATPSYRVEGRAIWLDRGSIVNSGSPEGLRKLLAKVHQAGINIIYFETLNAGFPMYASKVLPANPLVKGWDPLKVAVEEGHKLGMEVHAWVWCFAVGNKKHNAVIGQSEDYAGPILIEKGMMSEALRGAGGVLVPSKQTEYWLSPASAKARAFLVKLYSEVVSNYDVDGLQLDYIRYPFQSSVSQMGYEPIGRERFEAETGMLVGSLDDYTLKAWAAWKAYQVTTFVKDVSETLKKIKPDLKLSAAVFPMRRAERIMAIQQDWETWIEKGWIDTLSPMSYTSSPEALQQIIETVVNSPNKSAIVYPGIAIDRLDAAELLRQLDVTRNQGSMGSTLFAMAHLDDSKVSILGSGPYRDRTAMPPHHDPLKAVSILMEEFQTHFNQLATKGELTSLQPEQVNALKQKMADFATLLQTANQQRAKGQIANETLTTLQADAKGLSDTTQAWLALEKEAHPFRAQYFNEFVSRICKLLNYSIEKGISSSPATASK